MIITTKELDEKLKNDPAGAYLFYGEEEYLKHHWLERACSSVLQDRSLDTFAHIRIDGGDIEKLKDEISSLPMLGLFGSESVKLIEMRDINFAKLSKSALDGLCDILSDVGDNAVILYTTPAELPEGTKKRPSPQLTALSKVCSAVNFERQTQAKLIGWLSRHFASNGCDASPDACRFLIDYCTPDMFILASETEKLCAYARAHGKTSVDTDMIKTVASPSRIFGDFDLSNALMNCDFPAAIAVVSDMKRQKEKPEMIMGGIVRVYDDLALVRHLADGGMNRFDIAAKLKLNEYVCRLRYNAAMRYLPERIDEIVRACAEADRDIKTNPVNKYAIIDSLLLYIASVERV